jgi:hypothetical protein
MNKTIIWCKYNNKNYHISIKIGSKPFKDLELLTPLTQIFQIPNKLQYQNLSIPDQDAQPKWVSEQIK